MRNALSSVNIKSLALRVLQEAVARKKGHEVCPTPVKQVGQRLGQDTRVREGCRDGLTDCGSPHCAGCYVVDAETGAKIHPPKCGEDYREWLESWNAKGRVQ